LEDLVGDLERTVNLEPDHISLYMLEEAKTGGPAESDPDLAAAMFRESARVLGPADYRQYEITNFARPGEESLHNTVYWEDGDFIGLGPSAHSAVTVGETADGTRIRWRNRPDIEAYLKDPLSCREELSREEGGDRAREALILGLRMTKGVNRTTFARRYGSDPMEFLKPHLGELVELGLIRFSADRVRLTTRGMLFSNEVFLKIL
jgi:oxygen-independent coproporphyrinogen-3 oxidase